MKTLADHATATDSGKDGLPVVHSLFDWLQYAFV
jgi:hypothetical protein